MQVLQSGRHIYSPSKNLLRELLDWSKDKGNPKKESWFIRYSGIGGGGWKRKTRQRQRQRLETNIVGWSIANR
jgi:hypothetical protein